MRELAVPRLGTYGLAASDIATMVARARQAGSMQGNPVVLTDDELAGALTDAI